MIATTARMTKASRALFYITFDHRLRTHDVKIPHYLWPKSYPNLIPIHFICLKTLYFCGSIWLISSKSLTLGISNDKMFAESATENTKKLFGTFGIVLKKNILIRRP